MRKSAREREVIDRLDQIVGPWMDGIEQPPADASELMPVILEGLGYTGEDAITLGLVAVEYLGPAAVDAEPMLWQILDSELAHTIMNPLQALMAVRPNCPERTRAVARFLTDEQHLPCAAMALETFAADPACARDEVLALAHDGAEQRRYWAARILRRPEFSDAKSLAALRRLALDQTSRICTLAFDGLEQRGERDAESIEHLGNLLDTGCPITRLEVAHRLGTLGHAAAATAAQLAVAAQDRHESVRNMATAALACVQGEREAGLPSLDESTRRLTEELRRRLLESLRED